MGTGEEGTPTKSSKPVTTVQEVSVAPTTPAYPDWSTSMQAFYGAGGTPPYFTSTVASPTPHPYMWGQHPMMPPYGTPVPYPALYPPGGVYAHPSITTAPVTLQGSAECEGKANEGKERSSSKKSKGNTVNQSLIAAKIGNVGKATSGSGNDVGTQSAESGSDGSLDSSDDNHNQEFSGTKKGSFDQMLADGANAQNSGVPANFQTTVQGNAIGSVPGKNLNSGMEIWNASAAGSGSMKLRPNQPGIAAHGMMNDQWTQQDERELKRQKRKQSNRESARRSRLRKQAECEELQHRVDGLNNENRILRDELQKLSEECEKLTSENDNMKEELTRLGGPEAVSNLEHGNVATQHESHGDEDKR